jgi:hypothetical protein
VSRGIIRKTPTDPGERAGFMKLPFVDTRSVNFSQLIQNGKAIVDKTLALDDLFSSGNVRITLPRGMGKTIMLSMFEDFLSIPLIDGKPKVPETPKSSPKYETFKNTTIFKDDKHKYFGIYF